MNTKKILLISGFIIIFLLLNTTSATTLNETTNSICDSQETTENVLTENNMIKQEDNTVYVNGNSQKDDEDGSIDSPYKTINNDNLQKIPSNSKIYVSDGIYELNSLNISKDVSIIGENRENVIFIPNETQSLFTIEKNIKVNFFNFTIMNFESDNNSLINNKGNLIIENINLINNTGTYKTSKKGNIFNEGHLEVRNSTFENNTASFAAAIYNTGDAMILNSDFNTNYIYNVGGAIYSLRGNLTVYDSRFYKNVAVSGAAIYNAAGFSYINNTEFIENDAEHFFGGAIYSTGVTIVNNSLFDSNQANMDGGAITNTNNFTIINSSFIENFANDNGGVIENVPWSATERGNLTIFNSSFIGNCAGNKGGVIINYNKDESMGEWATVTARNCLFEGNTAVDGGVIYNEQYMDFQNNVFLDNEADENYVVYSDESSIKSLDNNWWGDNNPSVDEIGVMPNKWIILNFTNTTAFVSNFRTNLQVSLNTNNYGESINSQIPERIATFYAQKTVLPQNNLKISSTLNFTVKSLGDNITVNVDNQYLTLQPSEKMDVIVVYDVIDDVRYKENVTITGSFNDVNGGVIHNTNIYIIINGKSYKVKTDSTGNYIFTTTAYTVGINNVTIGYNGNDRYNKYESNTTFNVDKQDIIITYEQIPDVKYKEKVTITGNATDVNANALGNINVRIHINGVLFKAKTDKTGAFTYTITANKTGTNNVVLSYGGNANYNDLETSTTFNVEKRNIIITYEPILDVKYKENVTVTGNVTDETGKGLGNINVLIQYNGKIYKAKTDRTGCFMLSITATLVGTNNITLSYGGNANYNGLETSTTFNVDKQDIIITYGPIEDTVRGENVTIMGKVVDATGKGLGNVNALIRINGKLFKTKTDKAGAFTFTTTATSVGINNVTLSYGGNVNYNGYECSATFNVETNTS